MTENNKQKRNKPQIEEIFLYLQDGSYEKEITNSKKRAIRRTANTNFKIDKGILYFKVKTKQKDDNLPDGSVPYSGSWDIDGDWRKVLRNSTEIEEALTSMHASPLGGHFGRDKTLDKIQKRYWWPNLVSDVKTFLQACERCPRVNRKPSKVAPSLHPIPVTKPEGWRSIGIDLVGPLRETGAGNKSICTVTCYYTKWTQATALPTKQASGVAQFLLELFLCFGFPKKLISDQGREFNNDVVAAITDALQVVHRRTTAYHPQCNGLTERFNQTLENMLLKLDGDGEWDMLLPQVVFGYNTSKHASTQFSPFYLMHGREPMMPDDVNQSEDEMEATVSDETRHAEIGDRVRTMVNVIGEKALKNIKDAQKRQKRNYDQRFSKQEDLPVGSKV